MEIHQIQSGNAILQVKIYKKEDSEAVILLHGGPGVPDEMTEVREILAVHSTVITFEQRGTGNSACKKCTFSMTEYIEDINRIAAYFNLNRVHLFGHSWGGLYAQIYASVFPDCIKSLFLCSPASGTGKVWKQTEREVFEYNRSKTTSREWIQMGINAFLGMLGNTRAYRNLYKQVIINYHKGYNVEPPDDEKLKGIDSRAGNKTRKAIKGYPSLPVLINYAFPVMITYGQYDVYGNSRKHVLNRFPDVRPIIVPDSGHTPWKHNLDVFKEIINDFYRIS